MRLDRFLRDSRLVKRRSTARSLVDAGAVHIDGKTAKASSRVKVGDVLRVRFESRMLRIRVLGETGRRLSGKDASGLFEVLEESALAARAPDRASSGAPMDFLKRA